EAVERARQRLPYDTGAGGGVGGEPGEPVADRGDGAGGQAGLFGGQRRLGHGEQAGAGEPVLGEQAFQVAGDGLGGLGRHAVEDEGEGGAAFAGGAQEAPRHLVGVAGGGGDEEPEVGGGEELGGQFAVGGHDGVDVGRVQQRQAGAERAGGHDPQVAGAGAGGAGEAGQHVLAHEPVAVGRIGDQRRHQRGGPQHARLGDVGPDEGVDQRRLARAGGAADDGEERRVDGAQPGQQVVVELPSQLPQRAPVAGRLADRQREQVPVQRPAQPLERAQQVHTV